MFCEQNLYYYLKTEPIYHKLIIHKYAFSFLSHHITHLNTPQVHMYLCRGLFIHISTHKNKLTAWIYGSSVSLHFMTSSFAKRYAFFRCDLFGSTIFIKIMSNNSLLTISDSVISGHRTSNMKLLTLPECSSLK